MSDVVKAAYVLFFEEPKQIPIHQDRLALVEKLNSLEKERWEYITRRGELKRELQQIEVELEQIDLMKMDIANQLGD